MGITRLPAPLLVAAALVAGGCGADDADGVGAGAEIAPASSAVFVSVANDPQDEQWQTGEELLERFPAGREALEALGEDGLDLERDVRAALGPEVDLVVLDGERAESTESTTVILTKPRAEARLRSLVENAEAAYELVDGWAVIAETPEAIAEFEEAQGDESLAETDAWEDATDDLPDDALVRGFVSGRALTRAAAAEGAGAATLFLPGGGVPSVGFAVRAEDEGVRLDAAMRTEGEDAADPYEASLPDELPGGALAYVSWGDAAARVREGMRQAGNENDDVDRYVAQAELALGLSLERDVLPLLEGEGGLAVYAAETEAVAAEATPAAVLVLTVEDDERALETVDRAVERASELLGAVERTADTEIGGVAVRTVSLDGGGEVLYAAFDKRLVVASAGAPLEALIVGDGDALADDAAYTEAREAAAAPEETVGFAYANVDAIIEAFGGEVPVDVRANREPLGAVFVHASRDGEETAIHGFLGID